VCHIPLPPSLQVGEAIACPECGAMLRLASIFPPIFELAKRSSK